MRELPSNLLKALAPHTDAGLRTLARAAGEAWGIRSAPWRGEADVSGGRPSRPRWCAQRPGRALGRGGAAACSRRQHSVKRCRHTHTGCLLAEQGGYVHVLPASANRTERRAQQRQVAGRTHACHCAALESANHPRITLWWGGAGRCACCKKRGKQTPRQQRAKR